MRAGGTGHQILYARQAHGETVERAPSKARVASRPDRIDGQRLARFVVDGYAFSAAPSGTTPVSA